MPTISKMQNASMSILSSNHKKHEDNKTENYFIFVDKVEGDIDREYDSLPVHSNLKENNPTANSDIIYGKRINFLEIEDGKSVEVLEIDSLHEREKMFKLVKLNGEDLTVSFDTNDCKSLDNYFDDPIKTKQVVISDQPKDLSNCKLKNKYHFNDLDIIEEETSIENAYIDTHPFSDKFSLVEGEKLITSNVTCLPSDQMLIDSTLKDTLILSWSYDEQNVGNQQKVRSHSTQTEENIHEGSPLNLFFCTFHENNVAETYCDLQILDKGSTTSTCTRYINKEDTKIELYETPPPKNNDTDYYSNLDDLNTKFQDNIVKTKRKPGRKRKSMDKNDIAVKKGEKEILESKLIDTESEINRRTNIRYSLRKKRKLKKFVDMEYIDKKVYKEKSELSCSECFKVFPTFYQLLQHAKANHEFSVLKFKCDICSLSFTRPHNLERHKLTRHVGDKKYKCEHCGKTFCRKDVIINHVNTVHLKETIEKKLTLDEHGVKFLKCEFCNKIFTREQNYLDHKNNKLRCVECSLTFDCRSLLRSHARNKHSISCDKCEKVCKNKRQLYVHKSSHNPKFKCNLCSKTFPWRSTYQCHMAQHLSERPFKCDVCNKGFPHSNALYKHKWQEHVEKNKKFKCTVCEKSFVYQTKFDSHMRSHTGAKPFSCNLCDLSFSQTGNLKSHIRSIHGVCVQEIKEDGTSETTIFKYKRHSKKFNIVKTTKGILSDEPSKLDLISATANTDTLVDISNRKDLEEDSKREQSIVTSDTSSISSNSFIRPGTVYEIVYNTGFY